jgi:hypothetical protein
MEVDGRPPRCRRYKYHRPVIASDNNIIIVGQCQRVTQVPEGRAFVGLELALESGVASSQLMEIHVTGALLAPQPQELRAPALSTRACAGTSAWPNSPLRRACHRTSRVHSCNKAQRLSWTLSDEKYYNCPAIDTVLGGERTVA